MATDTVHDVLGSRFDSHSIVRQLHDVPPHEVYEVTVDGRRAVYKGDTGPTGRAAIEGRVTAFVDEETSVPVPEILRVGDEFYVAAWHPEAPVPDESGDTANWAAAAGAGLATLHAETAPKIDSYGQFRPTSDGIASTGHHDFHGAALEYVRHYRPVLDRYGHADIADEVLSFLTDDPDAFAGTGEAVLCHGWATPEHVTVADGEVACLVDFEHAIAAPGAFDFWRTVGPAFDGEAGKEAFREGYESVRSLPSDLAERKPLYALLNVVYYFVSLYEQDQHGPEETARRAAHLREVVTGILDSLD